MSQNIEINNKPIKLTILENNIKYLISNFFNNILNKRDNNSPPTNINPIIIYLESIYSDKSKQW